MNPKKQGQRYTGGTQKPKAKANTHNGNPGEFRMEEQTDPKPRGDQDTEDPNGTDP